MKHNYKLSPHSRTIFLIFFLIIFTTSDLLANDEVSLALPVDYVCLNGSSDPIQMLITPSDGFVSSTSITANEAIIQYQSGWYFLPNQLPHSMLGETITFEVNGQPTDAELVVFRHPSQPAFEVQTTEDPSGPDTYRLDFINETQEYPEDDFEYLWDIDGHIYEQKNPSHTLNVPEGDSLQITAQLTVINGYCEATYSREVTITHQEPYYISLPQTEVCRVGNMDPIPIVVSPETGLLEADPGYDALSVVEDTYYFDPNLLPDSYLGQPISFTVNGQPVDAELTIYRNPNPAFQTQINLHANLAYFGQYEILFENQTNEQSGDDFQYEWFVGNDNYSIASPSHFTEVLHGEVNKLETTLQVTNGACAVSHKETLLLHSIEDPVPFTIEEVTSERPTSTNRYARITSDNPITFRYTTDGTLPTADSEEFTPDSDDIVVQRNKITPIKAQIFHDEKPASRVETLWIGESSDLVSWGDPSLQQFDIPEIPPIVTMAAGNEHATAIDTQGNLYAWGDNEYGQTDVPVTDSPFIALASGSTFTLGLTADGEVIPWGHSEDGVLDIPDPLPQIAAIDVGSHHALALDAQGFIHCWGRSENGECDIPNDLPRVVQIAADRSGGFAVDEHGGLHTWGSNDFGERNIPSDLNPVADFAAGDIHAVAVDHEGHVRAWGNNSMEQTDVPEALSDVVEVETGIFLTYARTIDNRVYAWGEKRTVDLEVPDFHAPVASLHAFASVSFALLEESMPANWSLQMAASDAADNERALAIGTSDYATHEFDTGLDQFAPPLPMDGTFDARITTDESDYFRRFHPPTEDENVWNITLQASSDANPNGDGQLFLSWNEDFLTDLQGIILLEYTIDNETSLVNLRDLELQGVFNYEFQAPKVQIRIKHILAAPVDEMYAEGWNLVGNAKESGPVAPQMIFSNLVKETFFGFNGSYTDETRFNPGRGYWLKLSEPETVTLKPPFTDDVSVDLDDRWNLISGTWTAVSHHAIGDPDGVVVPGTLYGYDNGYYKSETIEPWKGYWILADDPGTITISAQSDASSGKKVPGITIPDGFVTMGVRNDEGKKIRFYLGEKLDRETHPETNPYSFRMPPSPPGDAFDIRFDDHRNLTENFGGRLSVKSPGDELTFYFDEEEQYPDARLEIIVERNSGQDQPVTIPSGKSESVPGDGLISIQTNIAEVTSIGNPEHQLPTEVRLHQNYPNPFNPATSIRYELPEADVVRLDIFDMTGRQIAALVNSKKSAGVHVAQFDASQFASGLYVYRLTTSSRTLSKSMMLIK